MRSSIQDASSGPVNSGAFINLGVGDTIARSMAKGRSSKCEIFFYIQGIKLPLQCFVVLQRLLGRSFRFLLDNTVIYPIVLIHRIKFYLPTLITSVLLSISDDFSKSGSQVCCNYSQLRYIGRSLYTITLYTKYIGRS